VLYWRLEMNQRIKTKTVIAHFSALRLIFAFLFLTFVTGCSKFNAFDQRVKEGVIEYQVTFPYLDDDNSMMASLLPEKMYMYFERDRYTTELSTVGGLFKNRFVSDQDEKELIHQLKIFKKKVEAKYDELGVQRQLLNMPQLTIIQTNEVDTIAGYRCRKAIGIFDHISLPEMIIYYTDEINVNSPNWCTQFHPLDGVLMQYEVEQLGIRMRFRAVSVQPLEVKPAQLVTEPGYEQVSPEQLQVEIEELLNTFNL